IVADEAVADNEEDGRKHTWVFDIREPSNPISIATFPTPTEADRRSFSRRGRTLAYAPSISPTPLRRKKSARSSPPRPPEWSTGVPGVQK
ncbi:MAG: hypothetical protein ACLP25_26490, partial [Roseiarcus sp.]